MQLRRNKREIKLKNDLIVVKKEKSEIRVLCQLIKGNQEFLLINWSQFTVSTKSNQKMISVIVCKLFWCFFEVQLICATQV